MTGRLDEADRLRLPVFPAFKKAPDCGGCGHPPHPGRRCGAVSYVNPSGECGHRG